MNLNHKTGQLFCSTHTGLGFCRCLNNSINLIEESMGIKNVMEGFMVEIDYDKKNGSIVGQFVDAKTKLFTPDLGHKPWNRAHGLEKIL